MWHIKLLRISSELWICRSHSIWWKLDFCQLCNLTAGCNFNNQLLITAFCLISLGWIKTNWVIYIPIVFCPLTVYFHTHQKHSQRDLIVSFSFGCWTRRCRSLHDTNSGLENQRSQISFNSILGQRFHRLFAGETQGFGYEKSRAESSSTMIKDSI